MCAVLDTSARSGQRYLRAFILREHKDTVEVRIMDVGGREKISKNQVFCLPLEFSQRPEFGVICSFACNPTLTDNKFKEAMINSQLEVRVIKKIGDGLEVCLTNSRSRKFRNNSVASVLESLMSGQRLKWDFLEDLLLKIYHKIVLLNSFFHLLCKVIQNSSNYLKNKTTNKITKLITNKQMVTPPFLNEVI